MGSDFEARRKEQEAARRAGAADRDAARRVALADGARAPSRADGATPSSASSVVAIAAFGVAALLLPVGLVTWGSPLAALAFGGAVVCGGIGLAARRFARTRARSRREEQARLARLAGTTLPAGPEWQRALERAQLAVRESDLDPPRRRETLDALTRAAEELAALNQARLRSGSPEIAARAEARIAGFIANCDEVAAALRSHAAPGGPSAAEALDAVAEHLGAEAEARAELDEALRRASTLRQPGG